LNEAEINHSLSMDRPIEQHAINLVLCAYGFQMLKDQCLSIFVLILNPKSH